LSHFALDDGFALLVLVVPDRAGAQLCAAELERVLADRGHRLMRFEASTPGDLWGSATAVLEHPQDVNAGAVWLAAPDPAAVRNFPEWKAAWQHTLEGLNQQRNPLRRRLQVPLVMVMAPWVVPLFRDVAPDLWSVRSQVIRIEPEMRERGTPVEQTALDRGNESRSTATAPDAGLAAKEVERLRRVPGRERELATMLQRLGAALTGQGDFAGAEAALREAASLGDALGDRSGLHRRCTIWAARSSIRAARRRRRECSAARWS
jgi:hypothetical protein